MTESGLQEIVIKLARFLGYRVAHFRPALTKHGWRTAVAGDGKGFPDLVLCHQHGTVLFVELKIRPRKLEPDQEMWRDTLRSAGAQHEVWTDTDWLDGTIERALLDGAGKQAAA